MAEKNEKGRLEDNLKDILSNSQKINIKRTFISQFFSNPLYYIGGLVLTGVAALGIGLGIGSAISGSQSEREMLLQKKVEECNVRLDKKDKEIQRLSVYEEKTAELKKANEQAKKDLNNSVSNYRKLKAEKADVEKRLQERTTDMQYKIGRLIKEGESQDKNIEELKKQNEKAKKTIETLSKDTFREYFNEGIAALEIGNLEKAKDKLIKAIMLKPTDSSAHYFFGKCFEKTNELEKAAHEYRNVISVDSNFTAARSALASVEKKIADIKERNSLEGQIRLLESQIKQNPNQEVLYLELGKKYIQKNERTKAFDILEKGIKIKPSESKPLQELYTQTISSPGELDRAISFYQEPKNTLLRVKNKPTVSELFVRLGRNKAESGNLEEAIKAFEKAINYHPKWAVPQFEYGHALLKQAGNNISEKKFSEINRYFKLAKQYDPKWAEPLLGYARLLRVTRKGMTSTIRNVYEEAIKLDPSGNSPSEYIEYVLTLNNAVLHRAKPFLRSMIQIHPKSTNLKLALADTYMGLKEWHNAILVLEQVNASDISVPRQLMHLEVAYKLGICQRERNLTDLAKTNFESANKKYAKHDSKAELEKIAQDEMSVNLWKSKVNSDEKKAQERTDYNRAKQLLEKKEFNSALWLLDRHNNSSSSDLHMLKGHLYMAVGKFQEAKSSFKNAERLEENKAKKTLAYFEKNVLRYYLEREADLYAITNKKNRDSFDIEKTLFELWNEAYKILPKNDRIKGRKSELARELGKWYEIMKDWDKSLEFYAQDEEKASSIFYSAKIKEEQKNDFEAAIEDYRKFLNSASEGRSEARNRLIKLLKNVGKRKLSEGKVYEAIDYLRDVYYFDRNLSSRYDFAVAYKEANMLKFAEEHFRAIANTRFLSGHDLKLREKSYFELGLMYKDKDPSEARDFFKGATRCNDKNIGAYMNFGELSLQLNDPRRAKWAYERAAELGNQEAKTKLNSIK